MLGKTPKERMRWGRGKGSWLGAASKEEEHLGDEDIRWAGGVERCGSEELKEADVSGAQCGTSRDTM